MVVFSLSIEGKVYNVYVYNLYYSLSSLLVISIILIHPVIYNIHVYSLIDTREISIMNWTLLIFVCVYLQYEVRVLEQFASEMSKLMPVKQEVDMSSLILAPMPGVLKSVAVKPGDMVSGIWSKHSCVIFEAG